MSSKLDRRICVVGAGPCGLTTLKNLRAHGFMRVVCYDEAGAIGGNWVFDENPERMSVYESTHIISSRKLTQFEDFPMPADYPEFPSHRQLRRYFEAYAAHFELAPLIRLRTRVERARLRDDGRWEIVLSPPAAGTAATEVFDDLIVCSGHHRTENLPSYPGQFSGDTLHSRAYKRADPFRGKSVLVVGAGNSGCDIAFDVARVARRTCLSARRGYYIVPKILFGLPLDALYAGMRKRLPRAIVQPLCRALLPLYLGPWHRYGLQAPECGPLEMHPTINTNILSALRDGDVVARVGIDRLDGNVVHFRDGSAEAFDTIIWATGFGMSFPFLDPSVVGWKEAEPPPLYLRMIHRRLANLFFIGLFQPIGCIWRLADHQARIAAMLIAGELERPDDLAARIDKANRSPHWRFDKSKRHAIEVDYHDFHNDLLRELKRAHPAASAAPMGLAAARRIGAGLN